MQNNAEVPQAVLEEWAASIEWLRAHPETLRGKRGLSAFVAAVVEGAQAQKEVTVQSVMIVQSDEHDRRGNQ
jgi:hypothetical protein